MHHVIDIIICKKVIYWSSCRTCYSRRFRDQKSDYITQYQHQWVNSDPVCHGIINWICTPLKLMCFRPRTQVKILFSVVKCKGGEPAMHQSCISRLVCIEPPVCYLSPIKHDVILCIHHYCACFSYFGWPPCQRSDMTLMEVSQHTDDYLYIRTIVLFVFLRNSCKPDMALVYTFVE